MVNCMYEYINNFFSFSILAFCYENILQLIFHQRLSHNPFFFWWMPIYGFGVVIVMLLTRLIFNRLKQPRWVKIICLFLSCVVVLTLLEQLGGMIIEAFFHKSYWDYSKMKFHIGKYICLEVSLLWGVFCMIYLYLVKPRTDHLLKKVPKFVSLVLIVIFLCDFIYSFFLK